MTFTLPSAPVPLRLSSAWHSWSRDDAFPRPPDSVPLSLGFILDFLPSNSASNPSEGRLILSPNRCLVHSLLHRFIYYPLSLSHQPSLPGLLQQPLINLLPGLFLPASFLCTCGSWPAVVLTEAPPGPPWPVVPVPPHRPSAVLFPGQMVPFFPLSFLLETLSECTLPFLSRPLSRCPLPFIQISVHRGPLTTAYCSAWFFWWLLSFIHRSFLSSVVWGACHCLEGCLAHNRWILSKQVFEFYFWPFESVLWVNSWRSILSCRTKARWWMTVSGAEGGNHGRVHGGAGVDRWPCDARKHVHFYTLRYPTDKMPCFLH